MLKCIPNRMIYMATLTFKNKYQELSKCLLWSIFNQISISYSGSKDVGTDCLNIGLVSVRQKIKFNQYFTNQKKKMTIFFFFLERPYPEVSSFKMTYSNCKWLYI